jgi:uncharacterized protein DUF4838
MSRRGFMQAGLTSAVTAASLSALHAGASSGDDTRFDTRGVVVVPDDISQWDWPAQAQQAGLNTIALHAIGRQMTAEAIADFMRTDQAAAFLEQCRERQINVEHEFHSMEVLLPRTLFDKNPEMFRMNEEGVREPRWNLCSSSEAALDVVCENAVKLSRILQPTTHRYFMWIDDGENMCRCPKCRGFSNSEQALLIENRMLTALRKEIDAAATLAHLCYGPTLDPPAQVKPLPGVFLEFAPIERSYTASFADRGARRKGKKLSHGQLQDYLDANLAVFSSTGAQVLEYWLDVSMFSNWKRTNLRKIPWDTEIFTRDLDFYAKRGIRNVTSFAVWVDEEYVKRFGQPPLSEYGGGLRS